MKTAIFLISFFLISISFNMKSFSQSMLFPVKIDGKYGYIDSTGKIVIPPKFNFASSLLNGYAVIKLQNPGILSFLIPDKTGFIDLQGNVKMLPEFRELRPFCNGLALAKKTGFLFLPDSFDFIDTVL